MKHSFFRKNKIEIIYKEKMLFYYYFNIKNILNNI